MTLGGCADFCVGDGLDAFTAPGWRDEPAPAVVWCQDAMVAGEIDPRFWHQGGQPRDEIHRRMAAPIEHHLGRPIRLPIEKISEMLGFSEASAFSNAFKTWESISPKDYRLNNR